MFFLEQKQGVPVVLLRGHEAGGAALFAAVAGPPYAIKLYLHVHCGSPGRAFQRLVVFARGRGDRHGVLTTRLLRKRAAVRKAIEFN